MADPIQGAHVVAGEEVAVGGTRVLVKERDLDGHPLKVEGTTKPTDASAGYQVGCTFLDTSTGVTYRNVGTLTSCQFEPTSTEDSVIASLGTIATTGNTDAYVIAPKAGVLNLALFSGIDALAQHGSNYITFSVTNLGQAGAGSAAMLAATDANTTKTTTGAAISANTKRTLTLNGTAANLVVAEGDRLLVRAAATGTLANTVTGSTVLLRFRRS